ncbi:hypothetical protein [Polaribacter glomeratus]|uniref:Uncharacterized protein n=1 Tax=Polaribacter glomeratus TaxID=102 RepID=A0A2S7WFG3_9FLAO|nr:hypothetical protein [Polaribacter glomeratus]PQJ76350.1 hypothetical protein BTO16_10565 [Polaribacter glomeratus]TXD65485.1 hypothetical protein ESX12_09870 [Polaribacter glomeratus]
MSVKPLLFLLIFSFCSCKNSSNPESKVNLEQQLTIANNFIDAFYSFNSNELLPMLKYAENSKSEILYYQGWAEGGNYEIVKRYPCEVKNDTLIICPVTVKDDLIKALELNLNVTDTFHIVIKNEKIFSITTSSNDPPIFYEAEEWIRKNYPELINEPCKGIWEDGTTPKACVRAMVEGYSKFIAEKKINSNIEK